jgi:hypothetical protein
MAIEVKALTYGKNLEEDDQAIMKLLREAKSLGVTYAVLTQFHKTIVYDSQKATKIAYFGFMRKKN